ncbi:MAG: hypothetical protein P4L77_10550 [Sulfuriferula sp.]|nr:hypothetical protein [Sulfuriferula sp.]
MSTAEPPEKPLQPDIAAILAKLPARLNPALKRATARPSNSSIVPGEAFDGIGGRAVYRMSRAGFTATEIAAHFGISRRRFFYWLKGDSELQRQYRLGRSEFSIKVLTKIRELALSMQSKRAVTLLARQFGIGGKDRDWPDFL